jgi:Uma2 family endonuclease
MPLATVEPLVQLPDVPPESYIRPVKRWTREEFLALPFEIEAFELIDGALVEKKRKNARHADAFMRLILRLTRIFGDEFVSGEVSVDLKNARGETSLPEPDVLVLRVPRLELAGEHATPAEILIAIEISDTTLGFDLTHKALLYAVAGIEEYLVFDLRSARLFVHTIPSGTGYRNLQRLERDESYRDIRLAEIFVFPQK